MRILTKPLVLVALLPTILLGVIIGYRFQQYGYPLPAVHDEFSYLLGADTFAHFRFANPTPKQWESFESFHINMVPTYVSMYPPAQALFLAVGQVIFGHPYWGVVLTALLFQFAVGWALLGWVPVLPALAAAMVALTFNGGTYWSESYWGGNVAAFAGALVLGSAGRMQSQVTAFSAALGTLGCFLLCTSRPFEGGILSLLFIAKVLLHHRHWRPLFIGTAPVFLICVAFLLGYCMSTTGHPLKLPYQENIRQYQIRRTFAWQKDRPEPNYRHEHMRKGYKELLRPWIYRDSFFRRYKIPEFLTFYGGRPILLICFCLIVYASIYNKGQRWPILCLAFGLFAASLIVYLNVHYLAPYSAFLLAAMATGLQRLRTDSRVPRVIFSATFVALISLTAYKLNTLTFRPLTKYLWAHERARIARTLQSMGGGHLVLVRYESEHDFHEEWVYNEADLENTKIQWARWWTPEKNRDLINAYPGRRVWQLEPDKKPIELREMNSLD